MQVCKYFLEAVEKKQYGWFWVCPNGGKDCHYRHALPPGYVLKSQMKALLDEETEKISIEEEIENQVIDISASMFLCHPFSHIRIWQKEHDHSDCTPCTYLSNAKIPSLQGG